MVIDTLLFWLMRCGNKTPRDGDCDADRHLDGDADRHLDGDADGQLDGDADGQLDGDADGYLAQLADEVEQKSKGGTNWRLDCEPLLLANKHGLFYNTKCICQNCEMYL